MCKKVLIAALAVIAAVGVVKWTWFGSHARLWSQNARNWVKNQVKIETEIQRLRQDVERLDREDRVALDLVARQRLDVKAAEEKLNKDQSDLARLHKRITELRTALKGPEAEIQQVNYNGASYSRVDAENQINVDYERYKPLKSSVTALEKHLASLRTALAQNEQTLFSGKQRRMEMLTQLQDLENELMDLRQAQTVNSTVLDDSNYGRVQKDIQGLKQRLAVEKEKLKIVGTLHGGPIEKAEAEKGRKEAREKELEAEFGQGRAPVVNK